MKKEKTDKIVAEEARCCVCVCVCTVQYKSLIGIVIYTNTTTVVCCLLCVYAVCVVCVFVCVLCCGVGA